MCGFTNSLKLWNIDGYELLQVPRVLAEFKLLNKFYHTMLLLH